MTLALVTAAQYAATRIVPQRVRCSDRAQRETLCGAAARWAAAACNNVREVTATRTALIVGVVHAAQLTPQL
jgi:uncharacterized MAPEG superfamily protein